jgi:hypothetical protein
MPNDFDTSQYPLGSTHPYVLYNNAGNEDIAVNDVLNRSWVDRPPFNRQRKTFWGMEQDFAEAQAARAQAFKDFLDASGFSSLGVYAAGIQIISHSQYVEYLGQPYALKATVPASLEDPYVTTGVWATESVNFKLVSDSTLRQDLLSPTGFTLIPSLTAHLDTIAGIQAYSGTATQFYVSGALAKFDGGAGFFTRLGATTKTADGGVYVADSLGRIWMREFTGPVFAAWYGVPTGLNFTVAPLTVDYAPQVKAAVLEGCTFHGGVVFPYGHIRIDSSITFPNTAFDLSGISGTGTEFYCNIASTKMFDFTSCNGPAKTMVGIGFSKTSAGGAYQNITGIHTNNTNGLYLENCWMRGLQLGLRVHGSFINHHNCAFEYNYWGVYCDTACTETNWSTPTFYKNEQVDARLTGDNSTFTWLGGNGISTRIEGIRMDNCTNAKIIGMRYNNTDNTSGFTPTICRVTGTSNNNYVDVTTTGLGGIGVFCEGSGVTDNDFTVNLQNTPATGSRGIKCSSSLRNRFRGNVSGWEGGVEAIGCTDSFDLTVSSCSVGSIMNGCNFSKWRVTNRGNTVDAQVSNTTIIDLYHWEGARMTGGVVGTGIDAIPYLVTRRGYTKHVLCKAAPNSLDIWEVGDTGENRLTSPSNAASWACTTAPAVGGAGGTWKVTSTAAA